MTGACTTLWPDPDMYSPGQGRFQVDGFDIVDTIGAGNRRPIAIGELISQVTCLRRDYFQIKVVDQR